MTDEQRKREIVRIESTYKRDVAEATRRRDGGIKALDWNWDRALLSFGEIMNYLWDVQRTVDDIIRLREKWPHINQHVRDLSDWMEFGWWPNAMHNDMGNVRDVLIGAKEYACEAKNLMQQFNEENEPSRFEKEEFLNWVRTKAKIASSSTTNNSPWWGQIHEQITKWKSAE